VRFRLYHPNAAAGLAAVATVCAVGAGAWPAPAAAAPAGASVLLITGDRVLTGPAPAVLTTAGAGRAGPVIQLSFAGQHYLIPSDAVPYLGHGLDMRLFDVSAVAGFERGGVLPVRVTYSGRVPSLPGVTITRASAGVASGYLTTASAGTFGTALAKLFASDRTRGTYGTDGMFVGGVRISLAGATSARAPRQGSAMHKLTVRGIDAAGQPANGGVVIVANVDDPKAFGESEKALGAFRNGVATFSVPAGTYWAVGVFGAGGFAFAGAVNGPTPTIVSANRSGNILTLDFMPFSDSVNGHLGTGYNPVSGGTISGTYQIKQNGTTVASGNALNSSGIVPREFYHQVTLSPKPSVISFALTARRTGAAFRLSSATRTTWTWRSAHEAAATVPSWWYCSFAGNHNCAAQALPILSYAVGGLALNGTTAPGAQSLAVTVGHLQLAPAQKITKVTVQASVNGGKTWTSAAVTGSGGTYHARYTAPARSHVTLRVTAVAATGAQVSETITRAYATAS
jgi:hypothetical protein